MISLEKTLKETIARIVRKETASLRAEVADLRKQLRALAKDHADYCKLDGASWDSQYEFNENIVDALSDAWKTLEEEGVVKPVAVVEEVQDAPAKKGGKKADILAPEDIRKIREKTGLSQTQFAKLLGVSLQTYNLWEGGKAKPRQAGVEKLASFKEMGKREIARLCKENGIGKKKAGKKAKKAGRKAAPAAAKAPATAAEAPADK